MGHHGIGDLHEAGYIGAFYVVNVVVLLTVLHALAVDVRHDTVQFLVYLSACPSDAFRVLSHLKTRSGNSTGINSLAWCEELLGGNELVDGFCRTAHVRHLPC